MQAIPGYLYSLSVGGEELKNVLQFRLDNDRVYVDSEYSYRGLNGGDFIGVQTNEYNRENVTIVRRVKNELQREENEKQVC